MVLARSSPVLIEATCNQVNHDGGHTGVTPADFKRFDVPIAADVPFDLARLVLSGHHLAPNPWAALPAAAAMDKASAMVSTYAKVALHGLDVIADVRVRLSCSGFIPLPSGR